MNDALMLRTLLLEAQADPFPGLFAEQKEQAYVVGDQAVLGALMDVEWEIIEQERCSAE